MTIYDLKPAFQDLLRPLCVRLASVGVTANQVTLAALLLSIVWGLFIGIYGAARWPLLGVPAVLLVRMALNAIDGMLAREHNMKSPLGAVLNELGDVASDTALYLPLTFVPGVPAWPVIVAVLLSVFSEMTGVVAVQIGASRRYDGPMGKSDRAFVFGTMSLLAGAGVPVGVWFGATLWIMCGLLAVTIENRVRGALGEVSAKSVAARG